MLRADEEGFRWEPATGLPAPLGLEEALAQSMGRAACKEPALAAQVCSHAQMNAFMNSFTLTHAREWI